MAKEKNRRFKNDTYIISVMRVIFMKFMRQHGKWDDYKNFLPEFDWAFKVAWETPNEPDDFLGRAPIMFETYLVWSQFLKDNKEYLNHLNFKSLKLTF